MLKQVTQTSKDCFANLDITKQEKEVLEALIGTGDNCIADLAELMNWQRSTISGRMNGLKKKELIETMGKRKSKTTGITSEFWRVRTIQFELF